jgi:hypothetical protein
MKHTDTTGKTWSGSGKQLGTEGAGVLVVYLSPRDGRVLRSACETMSETSKAIEDLRGRLQSLRWCQNSWQLKQQVRRRRSALLWEEDKQLRHLPSTTAR